MVSMKANAVRQREWRAAQSEEAREEYRARDRVRAKKRYQDRPEWAKDRLLRQFHDMTLNEFFFCG